jgi:predicted RNase H-like nuclease
MIQGSYATGIDGCRAGWLVVRFDGQVADLQLSLTLPAVQADAPAPGLIFIDMPIGLVSGGPAGRTCDQLARRYLSPLRHSSVFTPPCRAATYTPKAAASAVNFQHTGKKLSQQSLNIIPKIKDLDEFLQQQPPAEQMRWHEAHPEVVFAALNRTQPLATSKKTAVGQAERLALLAPFFTDIASWWGVALRQYPRSQVQPDDVLDALALAVAAWLCAAGQAVLQRLPDQPPLDDTGLWMQIVFARVGEFE